MVTISAEKLRAIAPMSEAIPAVRQAFIALADGRADQPQRLSLQDGSLLAMVARVGNGGAAAKLLSINPANRDIGLPTIQTVVVWFSPLTGVPTATIHGEALTTIRTGAASGVATDLLAIADAKVLGVFGAGALAPDQIRAVLAVRQIQEVRVLSLHHTHSTELIESMRREFVGVSFRACRTAKETVDGADVICTATTSSRALFDEGDIKPGCHVNALGAFRPTMCEIPPALLKRAHLVSVDHIPAAVEEAGDIIQAIDGGWIERSKLTSLGTLLESGMRRDDSWVTVFKSVGVAVQDWAIAALAVDKALAAEVSG